jgi:hypothetical protein
VIIREGHLFFGREECHTFVKDLEVSEEFFFLESQLGSITGQVIVDLDYLFTCLSDFIFREYNLEVIALTSSDPCCKIAQHCDALTQAPCNQ